MRVVLLVFLLMCNVSCGNLNMVETKVGIASWYEHPGLTAAMWDVPKGTIVKVTNLTNNKSVKVKIDDRGPNHRLHRVIDLSMSAFKRIAMLTDGLVTVRLEYRIKEKKSVDNTPD